MSTFWGIIVLACTFLNCAAVVINPLPANVTASIGQNVTFECGLPQGTKMVWIEYVTRHPSAVVIYANFVIISNPSKYSIDGYYNLIVWDVQKADGGRYECQVMNSSAIATAALFVIDEPVAHYSPNPMVDGSYGDLNCTVTFGGNDLTMYPNQNPRLEILVNDVNTEVMGITEQIPGKSNEYFLTAAVNATAMRDFNGQNMICRVTTANPFYEANSTLELNVTYTVNASDITIFPSKMDFYVGETLNCSAGGNPTPHYTWKNNQKPTEVKSGSVLDVTSEMVGSNNWTCEASNAVDGITYTADETISFSVGETPVVNSAGVEGWVIALCVIIPVLVIAAVAAAIFLYYRKKKGNPKDGYHAGYSQPPQSQQLTSSMNMANRPHSYAATQPRPTTSSAAGQPANGGRTSPGYADLGLRNYAAVNTGVSNNPKGNPYQANGGGSLSSSGRSTPTGSYHVNSTTVSGAFV